jgi:hypothetical protein
MVTPTSGSAATIAQLGTAILSDVVTRFANLRESTSRLSLLIKFEGQPVGQTIAGLVGRNLIRNQAFGKPTEEEQYLPTAAGFGFCGKPELRDEAKAATSVVLHTLKQMFKGERKKEGLTLEDLERHVDYIYPNSIFENPTLKLGLYLAKDFNVINASTSPDGIEVTSFRITETAIAMANPDAEWDAMMSRYRPAEPTPFAEPPAARLKSAKAKENHQIFLPAGSQHVAYVQMRKIVKGAKREILIVDNYVDHTLWELLTNAGSKVKVRILTNHMKGDFRLEGRKFVAQYGRPVEVRKTTNYHDRFIIADGLRCWHIGTSIKDAGSKAFAFSELVRAELVKAVISDVNTQWSVATIVAL